MRDNVVLRAIARLAFTLGTSLWMGGMAFFGIMTAPFIFRIARQERVPEIAPEMVTAILGRFTWFTYVCAGLLVFAWLLEFGAARRSAGIKNWWLGQGVAALSAGCLALYLGLVLFPTVVSGQKAVVPLFRKEALGQSLTPQEQAIRAEFDKGHEAYNKLASLSVWLLLASALTFSVRTSLESSQRLGADAKPS